MAVAIGHVEPPHCYLPMFLPHGSVGSAFQFRLKMVCSKLADLALRSLRKSHLDCPAR